MSASPIWHESPFLATWPPPGDLSGYNRSYAIRGTNHWTKPFEAGALQMRFRTVPLETALMLVLDDPRDPVLSRSLHPENCTETGKRSESRQSNQDCAVTGSALGES